MLNVSLPRSHSVAERQSNTYRPDIDGLRAVAILPVIAYHVGIHAARGGFVGVDVFFVISGYLISQVLLADIQQNRLSILQFYERRIRRIFPALLVVLATTSVIYLLASLPSEFVDFSKSLIAAALSVSNFYFWLHAGYFDGSALTRPLLHTWSLAVEEQFYLLWPAYLYVGYRYSQRYLIGLTIAIALISLTASAVGAFTNQTATFYLLHTRAWELLTGSLLALGIVKAPLGAFTRNLLSIIGITLIGLSVCMISADLPFPGLLALPPCIGAVLIILAGRDGPSWVGRVLSWRPIVFIGLISYSLYLWHWPITVLQKGGYLTFVSGQSEKTQKLAIIIISIVLAALSWKFIEQPFRSGPWRPHRRTLMSMAATGTCALIIVGLVGWNRGGFPKRYSDEELRIASYLKYDSTEAFRVSRCFLNIPNQRLEFSPECLSTVTDKKNYLLVGDSHAADLWYGLNATYGAINFLQATSVDCYPTLEHGLGERPYCVRLMDGIFHGFLATHHIDRVVISARWTIGQLPRLSATLSYLKQRQIPVTLMGPVAIYDGPLPRLLLIGARSDDLYFSDRHWDQSVRQLDKQMSALAGQNGAQYLSMLDLLCVDSRCLTTDPWGMPIFFDNEHFTAEGSLVAAQKLKRLGLWETQTAVGEPLAAKISP